MPENGLGFPGRLPLSLARMNVNPFYHHPVSAWLLTFNLILLSAAFPAAAAEVKAVPAGATAGTSSASGNTDAVANSVVKVFSTVRYPDFYRPWAKESP